MPPGGFANHAEMQLIPVREFGPHGLAVGERRLRLFSSVPLPERPPGSREAPRTREAPGPAEAPDPAEVLEVSEAVVVVHGALRNAGDYYRSVRTIDTGWRRPAVIAPQFLTDTDLEEHPERSRLLHWRTEDWKGGLGPTSSFTAMDVLLSTLDRFARLERVTIVGNSAGGQFVNRYAAVGDGPDGVGFSVRFVVANPSTYLYFDPWRPIAQGPAGHRDPAADRWRYGFGGEPPAYVHRTPADYFARYVERDVTYLLGEEDNDPGAVLLEVHPAAQAQGRTRRERGERYVEYLAHRAGRPVHDLVVARGVGHDAAAVFSSPQGRPVIFPWL